MLAKYGEEATIFIEDNYRKPMPIDFNYRSWLEAVIETIKGESDEFILNYMEMECVKLIIRLSS